jgi:hypothetical protein
MATVQVQEWSGNLNAGASTTIPWKNYKQVVGFWARPKELPGPDPVLVNKLSFEITKVLSMMDKPNHFRTEVTIKNSSTVDGTFVMYCYFLA